MKLKVDNFKKQAEFFGKIFQSLESRDGDLKEICIFFFWGGA